MDEKGEALVRAEHAPLCEKVVEKVTAASFSGRVYEIYAHHREWVQGQLDVLSERLEKRFLEGFGQLRKEVEMDRKAGSNAGK